MLRVTGKKSCALDGGPSCERSASARQAVSRREKTENRFKTLDSVDSAILTKV